MTSCCDFVIPCHTRLAPGLKWSPIGIMQVCGYGRMAFGVFCYEAIEISQVENLQFSSHLSFFIDFCFMDEILYSFES